MTVPSRKAVEKLGERFRKGQDQPGDRDLLLEYQELRSNGVTELFARLAAALAGRPCELSARVKRVDTIIRKLQRSGNRGMDLSRMDDAVGFRVVTTCRAEQEAVVATLLAPPVVATLGRDYVQTPQVTEYRAVHLVVKQAVAFGGAAPAHLPCEIQVRTLYQHLWASESESFGEQTKEGGGPDDVRAYLAELAERVRTAEEADPARPQATDFGTPQTAGSYFVLQYHTDQGLISQEAFGDDLTAALNYGRHEDEIRRNDLSYGTVLLYAADEQAALGVTNRRFIDPSGRPALPDEIRPAVPRPRPW